MAQYVLLEFDNDVDAKGFVEALNRSDALFQSNNYDNRDEIGAYAQQSRHVATFQKPTQFCQCTQEQKAGKVGTTGQRFGWFVCGNCKRPTKGGNQRIYNLLENDGRPSWKRELFLNVLSRY